MTKAKRKKEVSVEDIEIPGLGIHLHRETASQTDVIELVKKQHKQIMALHKRLLKLEQAHPQQIDGKEVVLLPDKNNPNPVLVMPKKVLKCADCGTVSKYATSDKCPVCGSEVTIWMDG